MLAEKDLKKIFNRLLSIDIAKIHLGESDITLQLFDGDSKMLLSSSIYNGGNFIPKSVRLAAGGQAPFRQGYIDSKVDIDENKCQVFLSSILEMVDVNDKKFESLLQEFSFQADHWRLFLDERDKNDLLPIFVR